MSNKQNGVQGGTTTTGAVVQPVPAVPETNPAPADPPKQTWKQKGALWCAKHPKAARTAKAVWEGVKLVGAVIVGIGIGRKTAPKYSVKVTPIEPENAQEETPAETEE